MQLINKLIILVINKFSRSEFIILSREDRKRSAISHCRKSFYRFGIRSCLATNHKQTLNDAIQHDVILHVGFPGNTTG